MLLGKSGYNSTSNAGFGKVGGSQERPKRLFNNSLPKIVQGASRNVVSML